jgi:hypothetical protein
VPTGNFENSYFHLAIKRGKHPTKTGWDGPKTQPIKGTPLSARGRGEEGGKEVFEPGTLPNH